MFRRLSGQVVALAAFFIFCQVIGTMCALPDLSETHDTALVEDRMACPMDETIMCPPSLTSSPARQVKQILVTDSQYVPPLNSSVLGSISSQVSPPPWSRSGALSIASISIASSSVLRI